MTLWAFWKKNLKEETDFKRQHILPPVTDFFPHEFSLIILRHTFYLNNRFRMKAHNMAEETHILSSMLSCDSIWTSSYVANTMKIFPLSVTRDFELTWWWKKFSLHIFMKADLHLGILSYNHECIQIENRQCKLCLELYISSQFFNLSNLWQPSHKIAVGCNWCI